MAKDVLITPASGKVEFKDTSVVQAQIYELNGILYIIAPTVVLGDGTSGNMQLGSVGVPTSIELLGGGVITSATNALDIGSSGDIINLNIPGVTYNLPNTVLTTTDFNASNILTMIKTVDGSGSGLDADLLDGQNGSYYLTWTNFTNTPTTLVGYGITDAAPSTHVGATGTAHGVATTSVHGFMSSTDKTKLDSISSGAQANQNAFSSIVVSGQPTVAADTATDAVTFVAGTNIAIITDDTTDTITINASDTVYTASNGVTLSGNDIRHADTSTQATVTNAGRSYIQSITLDTYGHITAVTSATETVLDTNTTYDISAVTTTGGALVRLTAGGSGSGTDDVKLASGSNVTVSYTDANTITISSTDTNTTYGVFNTTTNGLVPLTTTSNTTDYLRRDGTWATPPNTVYTHPTTDGDLHVPTTGTTNNGKALIAGASAGVFAWTTLTATMVGLGNVNNTSDADKPISTATQTALNGKQASLGYTAENTANKGAVNGYAGLGADGKVPSAQLPSYVDDVLEYANFAAFPATGETGKIYIDIATSKTYRWSGTVYVYITSGAVDSVAGKTGVVTLVKGDVGLGNVDNTSDAGKPVSTATQTALDLKANLASPTFTGTVSGITATMVGLGNVNNTSDANKPISTATQTALNAKLNKLTNQWLGEISFGATGYLYIGKFRVYDTNITVNISSTTNVCYRGTLVMAFQNYLLQSANVFSDENLELASRIKYKIPSVPDPYVEVYFQPPAYSKNIIEIIGVSLADSGSDIITNVASLPGTATGSPTSLMSNYATKASPTFTGTVSGITAAMVGLGNVTNESKATMFASPTFTGTVSGITATMVGLGNVTNESKATMFASPTFTGTVSGITATMVGLGNVTNESKATMFTSPTFTGTPLSTTAAVDTTTTQVATTEFVINQAASVAPLVSGTAAVGTSKRYARQDHVHPSPSLSGSSTFNSTTGVTITHNLGHTNYIVAITPTSSSSGYLGEYYVTKSANSMVVYCTGSTTTTTFDYIIIKN